MKRPARYADESAEAVGKKSEVNVVVVREHQADDRLAEALRAKENEPFYLPAKNFTRRCTCAAQASMIGSASLSGGTNAPFKSP